MVQVDNEQSLLFGIVCCAYQRKIQWKIKLMEMLPQNSRSKVQEN